MSMFILHVIYLPTLRHGNTRLPPFTPETLPADWFKRMEFLLDKKLSTTPQPNIQTYRTYSRHSHRACFNCRETGHYVKECGQKRQYFSAPAARHRAHPPNHPYPNAAGYNPSAPTPSHRAHPRGARSARADARLCTSSGINLIVSLSFHLVR